MKNNKADLIFNLYSSDAGDLTVENGIGDSG